MQAHDPTGPQGPGQSSRRGFLDGIARIGGVVAAVRSTGLVNAHAAGSEEIRLAVVGCGGRGSGAVRDAIQGRRPHRCVLWRRPTSSRSGSMA